MSRKKNVKRSAKRQASPAAVSSIQKMENDFLQTPARLATQLDKEISTLKQKEIKAKKALAKIDAQVKRDSARIKATSKTNTASAKKQLVAAKKVLAASLKTQAATTKEIQEIVSGITTASNRRTKFMALGKQLTQFEKEWAKKAKKAANKPKATRKKLAKAKAPLTVVEQPENIESFTQAVEEANANQITELAS